MKDNLHLGLMAVAVAVAVVATFTWMSPQKHSSPIPVSFRTLDTDSDYFTGRDVRLSTEGMQPGDNPNELVFRCRADLAPIAVCRFKDKVPSPIPTHIIGHVHGKFGAVTVVVECR